MGGSLPWNTIGNLKVIFLGLETSGFNSGLALMQDDSLLGELWLDHTRAQASHNETIIDAIDQLCHQAGLTVGEISGICLTIGPGMFTALRVGLSVAKGIALPRGIPVKGVNTLQALSVTAVQGMGNDGQLVLAAISARQGEVYAGLYKAEQVLITPMSSTPERVAEELQRFRRAISLPPVIMVAGTGKAMLKPAIARMDFVVMESPVKFPSPALVVKLGRWLMEKEGPDDLVALEPLYLRHTDAEINRERQLKSSL